MIDAGIVQGSEEMAVPVYYGKNRVDVHTDIQQVEVPTEDGGTELVWQYHEYQYTLSEYMQVLANQQFKQGADIEYIAMMADVELPEEEEE